MDSGQAKAQMPLVRGTEARACPVDTGMPRYRRAWCSPASLSCCFLSLTASSAPCHTLCHVLILPGLAPVHLPLWCSPRSPRLSDTSYPPLQILCPHGPVAPSRSPWLPAISQVQLPAHPGASLHSVLGCLCAKPRCAPPKSAGVPGPCVKLITWR